MNENVQSGMFDIPKKIQGNLAAFRAATDDFEEPVTEGEQQIAALETETA